MTLLYGFVTDVLQAGKENKPMLYNFINKWGIVMWRGVMMIQRLELC